MAKNFKDLHTVDAKDMNRDQAMIYIINFFNSRMSAVNEHNVSKTKELISTHEISVSELVDKYVQLVLANS
jgi:hypothetical protein